MKKVLLLLSVLLLSMLVVVGCSPKEIEMTFNEYSIDDTAYRDDTDVDDKYEKITVQVNSDMISESTINQITDLVRNPKLNTEIEFLNVDGDQIATFLDMEGESSINIDEDSEAEGDPEVIFTNEDNFKSEVAQKRTVVIEDFLDTIQSDMKIYSDDFVDKFTDELLQVRYVKQGMKEIESDDELDSFAESVDEFKIQAERFNDDERLKEPLNLLLTAHENYLNLYTISSHYRDTKDGNDAQKFIDSIKAIKESVKKYDDNYKPEEKTDKE